MSAFAVSVFALSLLSATLGSAQTAVNPDDHAKFNDIFDNAEGSPLRCRVTKLAPIIDFAFRFNLGYIVTCDIRQFEGLPGNLRTFLRIRTAGHSELILGDQFSFAGLPNELKGKKDPAKIKANIEFSGALATGMGEYRMDLLVFDNRRRICRHTWNVTAFPHGAETKMDLSMQPGAMAPLLVAPLPGTRPIAGASRLTILLNAAPINPYASLLRAWDRAFLLEALASLLRQLPSSSVRVVAFNLAQQRQIFYQDDFSQEYLPKLNSVLRKLELGTVPYRVLERTQGWADLLLSLIHDEATARPSSDALVFLGPTGAPEGKIPREILAPYADALPHVFCLTFYPQYGGDFSDSIQNLTSALRGRVFHIHNPSELAENIDKLKREMTSTKASR